MTREEQFSGHTPPIVRAKLYRPRLHDDLVQRERLVVRLDEGRKLPLMLLSAPAGYGKSTLVRQWLETVGCPSAWLSLDGSDSDQELFLMYLVAALRSALPQACQGVARALQSKTLLPIAELAGCLSNDLDTIEEPFVLVLDDYHHIRDSSVHELMDELLAHPPASLHLVVITRHDPPLSLGSLRAHHMMDEIRLQDLAFTRDEVALFAESALGHAIGSSSVTRLHESTEGWAVGLRLAALALRQRTDVDEFVSGFGGDLRQVQEYLVGEVLSLQPATIRDMLCKTSILERFCAPLCEAVYADPYDANAAAPSGSEFIQCLNAAGLPCVSLDEQHEWFRFHRTIKELLHRELDCALHPDELADLHRRAAAWLEAHGWLEEAFQHTLKTNDPVAAGRLVVRHRNEILNGEQWHRLHRWLRLLPAETVENDGELLLLKAWLYSNHGRNGDAMAILDDIETSMDMASRDPSGSDSLRGGVDALRADQRYKEGRGDLAVECAERIRSFVR